MFHAVAKSTFLKDQLTRTTTRCSIASSTCLPGGAAIIAIRHPRGELETQPPAETVLGVGDMIIAMGPPAAVERLDRLFQPPRRFSSIRGAIQEL